MKFKGFAEFGLLLASFSYALEKMVEEGANLPSNNQNSLELKKEESFDDIIKEFERLAEETKNISSFTEPVVKPQEIDAEAQIQKQIDEELLKAATSIEFEEEKVEEEDLAVVNELRKRILDAFKEKETEVEEIFDVATESIVEEEEPEVEEEIVFDKFDVNRTDDQVDRLKSQLINDFNEYIADVRNVYNSNSRIGKTIDAMAEHASIMKNIKKLYPNLEDAFINEYYRLKDAINSENVENKKSIILHRLSFTEKDNLLAYANHMMNEGMVVNVDENKLIADVIRPIVTKNGKVMAEIFKVANTAAAYCGFYVGYLVK